MTKFYDREGNPIELLDWATKFEDISYKVVEQTTVGSLRVSTIWLGFDDRFDEDEGADQVFETAIITKMGHIDEKRKAATEEEARANHQAAVAQIRGKG